MAIIRLGKLNNGSYNAIKYITNYLFDAFEFSCNEYLPTSVEKNLHNKKRIKSTTPFPQEKNSA